MTTSSNQISGPFQGISAASVSGSAVGSSAPAGGSTSGGSGEATINGASLFDLSAMRSNPETAPIYKLLTQSVFLMIKHSDDFWHAKEHEDNQKNANG